MKKGITEYFSHFSTIRRDIRGFLIWLFASLVVGLHSVWLPGAYSLFSKENYIPKIMEDNPFVIFSLLFITEAFLATLNVVGASSNNSAMTIRTLAFVIVLPYGSLLLLLSVSKYINNLSLSIFQQIVLLLIAILVGIYLYGFRGTEWEKTVADVTEEQDKAVDEVTQKAVEIKTDGSGTEL